MQDFAAANLPLAFKAAERWRNTAIPQEDVKQLAVVGLLEAIELWDPRRAKTAAQPFAAYAFHRMRYRIARGLRAHGPLVPVGRPTLELQRRARRSSGSIEEIAAALGERPERVGEALGARSISVPFEED